MSTSAKTPYEILGVARNSTNHQLLVVYRTKIHEHLQNKISPLNFRLICRAHETLSDYTKRKQYDSLKKWIFEIPIDRYTPQQLAAEPHLIHHLKKLLENANLTEINAEDPITGYTILYCAARAGNIEAVKFLTERGSEPDLSQRTTSTALHVASFYGHANVVRYLLENGADYRIVNPSDRTAEEEAYGDDVKRVFAELKRSLYVRAAADELDWFRENGVIQHIDTEYFTQRQTLLHCASKKGYFDMVRWLVEQCSANVDLIDINGNSPLHLAVYGGHLDIVDYLLNRGCNSTLRNRRGITAEEGSKHSRWIADLFESMRERDMFEMARQGVDWWFHYYFDDKSKDMIDSNGISLLYYACRYGKYSVAKWLLEHGANVNIQMTTEPNNTPLHGAKFHGHMSIVELLLEYGAEVNIKNDFDETVSDEVDSSLLEKDSHELDEEKPVVELQIDHKSICDDLLQTLAEDVCNVEDYFPIAEHSLDLQQTDTNIMSTVSCVRYMNSKLVDRSLCLTLYHASIFNEEKIISSSPALKFPFTDKQTLNSGDLTLTFSANCIQDDDTIEITRFYPSDLRKYDLPNVICLLKKILSNTERSDAVLLLLLASISHQSYVHLYMLTIPLSYSFSSDTRLNQLSVLDDIHAFLRHVNIIPIHITSPADLFISATVGHSLKTPNNPICLTLLSHIDYHETNVNAIQSTLLNDLVLPDTLVSNEKHISPPSNHSACTLSNHHTFNGARTIFLNRKVYYGPNIPYPMSFTHSDQKSKIVRKRRIKRNNLRATKCTIPISKPLNGGLQIQRSFRSMPFCSSHRLILSPLLKWPQWLHLLHRMDT